MMAFSEFSLIMVMAISILGYEEFLKTVGLIIKYLSNIKQIWLRYHDYLINQMDNFLLKDDVKIKNPIYEQMYREGNNKKNTSVLNNYITDSSGRLHDIYDLKLIEELVKFQPKEIEMNNSDGDELVEEFTYTKKTNEKELKLQKEELKETTLKEHYLELRLRILISLISFIVAVCIAFAFAEEIYTFLAKPLLIIMNNSNELVSHKLIFTHLSEVFFTYCKLSLFAGFIIAFPIIISQIYFFISPGLYKNEKKIAILYIVTAPILFIIGSLIAYYFVMPMVFKFFLSFEKLSYSDALPIILEAKINEYLDLVIELIIGFGIAFQLPIILTLLTRLGLITTKMLTQYRRHSIVLIFIIAAILTPPDVISQIILAIPLLMLYEIAVLACRRIEKLAKNNLK